MSLNHMLRTADLEFHGASGESQDALVGIQFDLHLRQGGVQPGFEYLQDQCTGLVGALSLLCHGLKAENEDHQRDDEDEQQSRHHVADRYKVVAHRHSS